MHAYRQTYMYSYRVGAGGMARVISLAGFRLGVGNPLLFSRGEDPHYPDLSRYVNLVEVVVV